MADSATIQFSNGSSRLTISLIVLAVCVVVGLIYFVAVKRQQSDPTLTAAPPVSAVPGHQQQLLSKTPAQFAMENVFRRQAVAQVEAIAAAAKNKK